MTIARRAYIHAGTHKTGTTSIQALLAHNDEHLRRAGIFVPHTGRITADCAGHHNLAWQLINPPRYDPAGGTLERMFAEVAAAAQPTVCLSSEEFAFLGGDIERMRAIWTGFRAIGYEPHVVFYLRPQADYLESLFAELVRGGWEISFDRFASTIIETGIFVDSLFDYDRLLRPFASIFGAELLHVRPYRSAAAADVLLDEFVSIIAGGRHDLDRQALRRPGRLNPKASTAELMGLRGVPPAGACMLTGAVEFAPLTLTEILRISIAFGGSNERVYRAYGARVREATPAIVAREIVAALLGGRTARARRRLCRMAAYDVAA